MQISVDWSLIGGAVLTIAAASSAAYQWWSARRQSGDSGRTPHPPSVDPRPPADGGPVLRSSDQQPPAGFVEHVSCLRAAAPTAEPATVLEYLTKGLTEAQTLRAEVSRMGGVST